MSGSLYGRHIFCDLTVIFIIDFTRAPCFAVPVRIVLFIGDWLSRFLFVLLFGILAVTLRVVRLILRRSLPRCVGTCDRPPGPLPTHACRVGVWRVSSVRYSWAVVLCLSPRSSHDDCLNALDAPALQLYSGFVQNCGRTSDVLLSQRLRREVCTSHPLWRSTVLPAVLIDSRYFWQVVFPLLIPIRHHVFTYLMIMDWCV